MALCQTHLKHLAQKNRSPAEVLSLLNEELYPRIRKDMFITLFLAVLDTKLDKITYSRAGHEPGLLLKNRMEDSNQAEVLELRGNGMALGMVDPKLFNELASNEEINFSSGDLLCLFTDGVTEAANPDKEEFGLERLKGELIEHWQLDPESLNQKIIQDLNKFSLQSPDRDDLTLLTIKRL